MDKNKIRRQKKPFLAVTKKELELRCRGVIFPVAITGLNAALYIVELLAVFGCVVGMRNSALADYRTFLYIYFAVGFFTFFVVLFIAPLFSASTISGERQGGTFDLLFTTLLSPAGIVTEKMLSAFISLVIITLSFLPAIYLSLFFGGVGFLDVFVLFIAYLPGIFLVLSIGFFAGSLSQTSAKGVALAYGICLVLVFGPILVSFLTANFALDGTNFLAYLMLLDPLYTVACVLGSQIGEGSVAFKIMEFLNFDAEPIFLRFSAEISILIQILLGIAFLVLSVINIMPGGFTLKFSKFKDI